MPAQPEFGTTPYTDDQRRAAEYIVEVTNGAVGGGNDPVGFLIAAHNALRLELEQLRKGKVNAGTA